MAVKAHITILTGLLTGALVWTASSAYAERRQPALLEIVDGDTAFLIDKDAGKAWWVLETCRQDIPLETPKEGSKTLSSRLISKDVRIGSHQVRLRQQYRFTLDGPASSLEVFNSMRGGWSDIPVILRENCAVNRDCQARIELPPCPT